MGAAGWGAGQFLKAETPPVVAVAERGERGWEPDEGDESEPVLPAAAAKTEAWNDVKYLKKKQRFSRHTYDFSLSSLG